MVTQNVEIKSFSNDFIENIQFVFMYQGDYFILLKLIYFDLKFIQIVV